MNDGEDRSAVRPVDDGTAALTHVDQSGRARMVDVGDKEITARRAVAKAAIRMSRQTIDLIVNLEIGKGDVLAAARLAGIMAAKRTAELVPLCHPLNLSYVNVDLAPEPERGVIAVQAEARCEGRTGVEMEALTAVSVAALTVYDMVKAVDRNVIISDIMLMEKSGGRSGAWKRKQGF